MVEAVITVDVGVKIVTGIENEAEGLTLTYTCLSKEAKSIKKGNKKILL